MSYQPDRRSFLIAGGLTALASTKVLGANDTQEQSLTLVFH